MEERFEFLSDEEIFTRAEPNTVAEKQLLKTLLENLGEISTIKEICKLLKISERTVYNAMEERRIIVYKIGMKNLIYTKSLLNIIREREV